MRRLAVAGGTLALAGLGACAHPQVFGLRHDRAFTYQSLDSGKIAVGGVTSIAGDTTPASSLLTSSLRDAYPHLEVQSAGAVATALGDSLHTELLRTYQRTAELDSAWLHELALRLPRSRYVVFARIETDVTDSAETVTQDSVEKRQHLETVVRTRFRTMTVGFHVYDLSLRRDVWSGEVMRGDTSSHSYSEPTKFVASVVTTIIRGPPKYPSVPTQAKVLRLLFDDFAESLPQPPKGRSR